MRALAAENPDGLGVVHENIVDGSGGFLAGDGDEAGFQTWALSSGERRVLGFAWVVEGRLGDSVVLALVLVEALTSIRKEAYLGVELELDNVARHGMNSVWEVLERAIVVTHSHEMDSESLVSHGRLSCCNSSGVSCWGSHGSWGSHLLMFHGRWLVNSGCWRSNLMNWCSGSDLVDWRSSSDFMAGSGGGRDQQR
jgi:hypothetical protein